MLESHHAAIGLDVLLVTVLEDQVAGRADHWGLALWLARFPLPARVGQSGLVVRLERRPAASPEQLVEARPLASPVPIAEPAQRAADLPGAARALPPGGPAVAPGAPAPAVAVPDASAILGQFSRYRLDRQSRIPPALTPAAPLRVLGQPAPGNLLGDLGEAMPQLPFGEAPMGLDFYPFGFRGRWIRAWDRLTPEFGFTTRFGLEVRCVYVLVAVACGWREK